MTIEDLSRLYGACPQAGALVKVLAEPATRHIYIQGAQASATPLLFASVADRVAVPVVFILPDADEAGYFYHDLTQIMGQERVLFFPSSYRRSVRHGQRDAANEILRTEVLGRLSSRSSGDVLYVVTHPEALAEMVASQQNIDDHRIHLTTGQTIDITDVAHRLRDLGFEMVDYVYEPGQYAQRGSIIDIYSYSSEYPYRVDFFGDEIDTIRTFEVEDQLSKDRKSEIDILPELAQTATERVSFLQFVPDDTLLVAPDFDYVGSVVARVYSEGFSSQALTERLEGATEMERQQIEREMRREWALCPPSQYDTLQARLRHVWFGMNVGAHADAQSGATATIAMNITPQPLFHKNFDLLRQSLEDYLLQGYRLFILADSAKQQQRLREIFAEMGSDRERSHLDAQRTGIDFEGVDKALHSGFADNALRICCFTDHQIFDRFHKYSLRSDRARSGKMALTMKELYELEPGDFKIGRAHV